LVVSGFGSVGIGTTRPISPLHVVGDVRITGLSTTSGVLISGGIVTSALGSVGVVTYYGDGSNLTGNIPNAIQNIDVNLIYYPLLSISTTGTISSISVSSNSIVFNPGPNYLGIGTTSPKANLDVLGNAIFSGIVTASQFRGSSQIGISSGNNYVGLTTLIKFVGSGVTITSEYNSVSGITTLTFGSVQGSQGTQGTQGTQGVSVQGVQGLAGSVQGSQGTQGTQGTQGVSVQGVQGLAGSVQGSQGTQGTQGTQGVSVQGVQGLAGSVQGVQGPSGGGSINVVDNTTTNATYYVGYSTISGGTLSNLGISSTKLQFNPSTGTLFATIFTSLSDRTQKENIIPIKNALNIVNNMNGVYYDWVDGHNQSSVGLIAQEVEKVLPQVISTNDDGLKTISYGNIVAVLIEAIKEQQIRIERLEDRLNA
jgi:hypothetical protein